MTLIPVPIPVPTFPALTRALIPQVLVLGRCSQVSVNVWGWGGSMSPAMSHLSPLAVLTCCHPFLGTTLPGRAPQTQTGAMVGTGAFAAASVPPSDPSQGVPARQGWGGTAVTGCHWLLLFPQGLEFPASVCHRYFQVPSPALHLSTSQGTSRCWLTGTRTAHGAGGHGHGLGRDAGCWAELEALGWRVWGRAIGVPSGC